MSNNSSASQQNYQVESVRESEPPPGADGPGWHRYVITQGDNTIHGHRQGNLRAVTSAVKEIVALLNERRLGKRGRVNLVPSAKKNAKS